MENKPQLSYFEIILYFVAIKKHYTSFLSPFFNASKIRAFKIQVYSLPISHLKKDKLWCYLNDDIDLIEFLKSLN